MLPAIERQRLRVILSVPVSVELSSIPRKFGASLINKLHQIMIAIIISILLSLGVIDSPQEFYDLAPEQWESAIVEDIYGL